MIISNRFTRWLAAKLVHRFERTLMREPAISIGGKDNPYMRRWWVIPRNPILNVYLHEFLRDDDDRALHDHPWWSASLQLGRCDADERYVHLGEIFLRNGAECVRIVEPGDLVLRRANFAHRMLVPQPGVLTLFITGPRIRSWGFHCPGGRWVHWRIFTGGHNGEVIGRGCGE